MKVIQPISITILEPAKDLAKDPYMRLFNYKLPAVIEANLKSNKKYIIERIVRILDNRRRVLVKWAGQGPKDNTWLPRREVYEELLAEFEISQSILSPQISTDITVALRPILTTSTDAPPVSTDAPPISTNTSIVLRPKRGRGRPRKNR